MLRFDGQVALITGAGRGIGRQHALFLAERGATVIVNDYGGDLRGAHGNNPLPADEVVGAIRTAGGTALAACCDIGDAAQVQAMTDEAVARFGRIDIVIHNASVYAALSPFAEASAADLERILRVNVLGGWHVTQAAWKHMVARGHGRIVMTGSGAGFFGRRKDHAYSVAKSALMGFTKGLATEGAKLGIKANLVGPLAWTGNSQAQAMPSIMSDIAHPIRVTNLVAVLAHDSCPVSGEMFHCGGGFVSRVFVGETQGVVFPGDGMTPEAVLEGMERVMDETGYFVPANSDRSGAHISAKLAAANPAFAEALAEAKRNRV